MDKNYMCHLPHPLFLLLHNEPETDIYILATKKLLNVPQDEYVRLYNDLLNASELYKLPNYSIARLYLTVLLELI